MTTDDLLEDRGATYGPWREMADVAQRLKVALHTGPSWHRLHPGEREALEMIATKMARAVSGRPCADNYVDIRGYAQLAEDVLP